MPEELALYRASWAIVIGVDSYARLPKLTGAVRDAVAIQQVLQSQGFVVKTLLDGDATRRNVSRLIADELPRAVREQDHVFIFFAGHGMTLGDGGDAMGYLMPVDGESDAVASTGVSMDELVR